MSRGRPLLKSLFIAFSIGTLTVACIGISKTTERVKPGTRASEIRDTTIVYGCYSVSNGAHVLDSTEIAVIDPKLDYFEDKEYCYYLIPDWSLPNYEFHPNASVPHAEVMHLDDDGTGWFTLVYVRPGKPDVLAVVRQISDCSKEGADVKSHYLWDFLHHDKYDFYVIRGGSLVAKTRMPPVRYPPRPDGHGG